MIQYFAVAAAAIFGLAVGSFLNVVIARLPAGQRISGRSRCPRCGQPIVWWQNIPLLSFFVLSRRCSSCGKPISWQYPAVEAATAVLFALVAVKYAALIVIGQDQSFILHTLFLILRDWFFVAVLVVIFVIDLRHYLILDIVTLPAAAAALAVNMLLGKSLAELVIGGILGVGFFAVQYALSRGRWIGDGDIRLGLLLGVMLGWPGLPLALFVAYCVGALVGLLLIAAGVKQFGSRVPLGTFLAAGGAAALLYGEPMLRWYLAVVGY